MRKLTLIGMACMFVIHASIAHARTTCQATPQGQLCISEVDFSRFAQSAYMNQESSQWCWAASISMVFAFHGHPVSQARIVTDVYGAPANIPAQAGIVIANELNRSWEDDNGALFSSTVSGVYDVQAGVNALTNAQIISELDQERPLIVGARTHAMVLTAIQYFNTLYGPNVVAAGVFDPWPGIGARGLQPDELVPATSGGSLRFAATVTVSSAPAVSPPLPDIDNGPDEGGSQECVPGTTVYCACPSSFTNGVQVCSDDGQRFGACTGCEGPDESDDGGCDCRVSRRTPSANSLLIALVAAFALRRSRPR